MLNARSVGSPAALQYSQLLKFHRSCWKIRLGWLKARLAQLVHCLLVGLAQEADVVDLEARRAPLVGGLEVEPLAADLGEPDLLVAAAQRGPGRVERRAGRPGRWYRCTGSRWVRAIAAGSPATRLRSSEPDTSYRPWNRHRASTPPV